MLALRQRSTGLRARPSSDLDSYFMCGLCDPNLEESCTNFEEELLEELIGLPKTAEAGTQTGLGLIATEAARSRAEPRKRAPDDGTTQPSSKIRAARELP